MDADITTIIDEATIQEVMEDVGLKASDLNSNLASETIVDSGDLVGSENPGAVSPISERIAETPDFELLEGLHPESEITDVAPVKILDLKSLMQVKTEHAQGEFTVNEVIEEDNGSDNTECDDDGVDETGNQNQSHSIEAMQVISEELHPGTQHPEENSLEEISEDNDVLDMNEKDRVEDVFYDKDKEDSSEKYNYLHYF